MSSTASPAETLPPELLAHIFLLAKQDQDRESFDFHSAYPSKPIAEVCTHVGTYFRKVALGCSLLWTTVFIEHRTQLDRVRAYCARSSPSSLLLRVDLEKAWCTTAQDMDHIFRLLQLTVVHSHRWEALSIHLGIESTVERSIVGYLCTSPAPKLESLTLSIDKTDKMDHVVAFANPAIPTIFTQGTNAISFLRLRGLAVHAFRPPLAGLTVFHLDGTLPTPISYGAFGNLITAISQLFHLSVYGDAVEGWPLTYNALSVISLPVLKSLRIHSVSGAAFEGVIMNINAPSLLCVTLKEMLENDLMSDSRRPDVVVAFPQVTQLTFCDFDLSDLGYRAITQMFPSTEIFRMESKSIGVSKIFAALSGLDVGNSVSGGRVEWPYLHTLHMGFDAEDDSWLVEDLVHTRKEMGCPLSRIEFTSPEHCGGRMAVNEWLAEVRSKDGFDVEVRTRELGEITWPSRSHGAHLDRDDVLFD